MNWVLLEIPNNTISISTAAFNANSVFALFLYKLSKLSFLKNTYSIESSMASIPIIVTKNAESYTTTFKGNKCVKILVNIKFTCVKSALRKKINEKLSKLNVMNTPKHFRKKLLL